MLDAQLEQLRFLQRAREEGLINDTEHAFHRNKLLRAAVQLDEVNADTAPTTNVQSGTSRAWQALLNVLADVLRRECQEQETLPNVPSGHGERPREESSPAAQPEPRAGPNVPAKEQRARRFTFDRRGMHTATRQRLPGIDQVNVELEHLWDNTRNRINRPEIVICHHPMAPPAPPVAAAAVQPRKEVPARAARASAPPRKAGNTRQLGCAHRRAAVRPEAKVVQPNDAARRVETARRAAAYVAAAGLKKQLQRPLKPNEAQPEPISVQFSLHVQILV